MKSLHSPDFANRMSSETPGIQIEGMGLEESRAFLDKLEKHVLQPRFRYDHFHSSGDLTIWSNFATIHSAPPVKVNVDDLEDARLIYRMTVKGPPSLTLPRKDDPSWIKENLMLPYTTPLEYIRKDDPSWIKENLM